ncbi:MAG: hypothetical protein KF757_05645 [Phycisphaeraceae bacterium]|nr:hypothetical protein [Phycisphaeraceae bacterium]MCW5763656.1 hypothetical protein [Phycisphaeraceae bacterium]
MRDRSPIIHLLLAISDADDELGRFGDQLFEPTRQVDAPGGAVELTERFRAAAADLIVWLEMRGRPDDANEIDDAIASLIEVARAYDQGELRAWLRDDERAGPIEPIDQLQQAMNQAAGRLEDLADEIPAEVWQGYDDA